MRNEHGSEAPQTETSSPWQTGDFIGVLLAAFILIPVLIQWAAAMLKGAGILPSSWPANAVILLAMFGQELALYWFTVGSVVRGYGEPLQSIGIFAPKWLRNWLWGFFIGGSALILLEQVSGALTRTLAAVFLGEGRVAAVLEQENAFPREMLGTTAAGWQMLGFLVLVIVVSPLAEEIFFRGFGYVLLRRRWGTGTALAVTSVSFALVHGSALQFLPVLIVGTGLGWIREKRGAVEASWGAHLALNLWAAGQMLAEKTLGF